MNKNLATFFKKPTIKEWECVAKKAYFQYSEMYKTTFCPNLCSITHYHGKIDKIWNQQNNLNNIYRFYYSFSPPRSIKVSEEYLVYDTFGMIGNVGGTLGVFIGFSFIDAITWIINYLQFNVSPKSKQIFLNRAFTGKHFKTLHNTYSWGIKGLDKTPLME